MRSLPGVQPVRKQTFYPKSCTCDHPHTPKRVVLTGGPGAGKTAILELVQQAACRHVRVLPEAAGIIFGGGFPRENTTIARQAAQRAIFHVQVELEALADEGDVAVVLCDRGTVDSAAYWTGSGDLWTAVGTTLAEQLARYDSVVHLRVPSSENGYHNGNPLRIETAAQALEIDRRIGELWAQHPRYFVVPAESDFLHKAEQALTIIFEQLPACCRERMAARSS